MAGGVLDDAVLRELRELRDGLAELLQRLTGMIELQQAAQSGGKRYKRSRYFFNKAILAVLSQAKGYGYCLSRDEVMERLTVLSWERDEFSNAWDYLAGKGVIVQEEEGCWVVK